MNIFQILHTEIDLTQWGVAWRRMNRKVRIWIGAQKSGLWVAWPRLQIVSYCRGLTQAAYHIFLTDIVHHQSYSHLLESADSVSSWSSFARGIWCQPTSWWDLGLEFIQISKRLKWIRDNPCTGWPITLAKTSWLQNKSSILAWPGLALPDQSGTIDLQSTGGFGQRDGSPCIIFPFVKPSVGFLNSNWAKLSADYVVNCYASSWLPSVPGNEIVLNECSLHIWVQIGTELSWPNS